MHIKLRHKPRKGIWQSNLQTQSGRAGNDTDSTDRVKNCRIKEDIRQSTPILSIKKLDFSQYAEVMDTVNSLKLV